MHDRQSNPHTVANDAYDAHIIPAETAARRQREGAHYKHTPKSDRHDSDILDTTEGYAIDSEGLVNNYGVEPEMYFEIPGDTTGSPLDSNVADRDRELAESNTLDDAIKLKLCEIKLIVNPNVCDC